MDIVLGFGGRGKRRKGVVCGWGGGGPWNVSEKKKGVGDGSGRVQKEKETRLFMKML